MDYKQTAQKHQKTKEIFILKSSFEALLIKADNKEDERV